jgi:hypothetical protein
LAGVLKIGYGTFMCPACVRGSRPLAMMESVERVLIKLSRSMRVESRRVSRSPA